MEKIYLKIDESWVKDNLDTQIPWDFNCIPRIGDTLWLSDFIPNEIRDDHFDVLFYVDSVCYRKQDDINIIDIWLTDDDSKF